MVPLMAMIFPARLSVGALLPMLIVGDIFAVSYYGRHTQWKKLFMLLPFVAVGMVPAFVLLSHISDDHLKLLLGIMILVLIGVELLRRKYKWENIPHSWWFSGVSGSLAGFGTAVGNAAGPVMGIYLVSRGFTKQEFMGTKSWFFFIVNVAKIPFYIQRGMIIRETFRFDFYMIPAIIVGVFLGFWVLPKIPQKIFNAIVLILAFAAAVKLLF